MDVAGKSPEWEGSGSGENMNCAEIPCASDGSDKSFSCVDMNSVTLTPEDGTSSWTKNIELTRSMKSEIQDTVNSRKGFWEQGVQTFLIFSSYFEVLAY